MNIGNRSRALREVRNLLQGDMDESVLEQRLQDAEKLTQKGPVGLTDLQRLLEDKSIDAISIAAPNHSHALQTIWGRQAGKDAYVERPCAHNIFEAKQVLAAAPKYNCMVQLGTDGRSPSTPRLRMEAVEQGVAVWNPQALQRVPSGSSTVLLGSRSAPIGPITLVVKCAGTRRAGNPHATCDVAGAGNGAQEVSRSYRASSRPY